MTAYDDLRHAFETRADGAAGGEGPAVGLFGEGCPAPLIVAAGGRPLDVKAPPLADATSGPRVATVDRVVEDFMDAFATRFLHRLAAGAFDGWPLILFARDDVAGLAAYQYATELRRQGLIPADGPRLHLWNMLHTDSAPAARFNAGERDRLVAVLGETLGRVPDDAAVAAALLAERDRARALSRLPAGGETAFVARAAGRWMSAGAHAAALDALDDGHAGQGAAPAPSEVPAIAFVGTACDLPVLHALADEVGRVHADLQDYGQSPAAPTGATPETLVADLSRQPLSVRAAPPRRYTDALIDGTDGADLVIASVDRNDDAFGWEIPSLREAVEARGARFLDLGFRPFRPDAAWIDGARTRIAKALA